MYFIRNLNLSMEIKKIFDSVNLCHKQFTDVIFSIILNMLIEHGTCTIQNFGKFICYKTYSTRKQQERIRIKFVLSTPLAEKLSNDSYIMNKINVKSKVKFNKETVEGKNDIKLANYYAKSEASKKGIISMKEKAAKEYVTSIIEGE